MCNSFPKNRAFSYWLVIVIAIITANTSSGKQPSEAYDSAAHNSDPHFVVERLGESRSRPVVFIPGLASSGAVFAAAADDIAGDHDVHIVTLAGFAGVPVVEPVSPYVEQLGARLAAASREQFLDFARQGIEVQSNTEMDQRQVMESMSNSNQSAVAQDMTRQLYE